MSAKRLVVTSIAAGVVLATGLMFTVETASAQRSPARSPMHYRMGGASPVPPAVNLSYNYSLGVSLRAGANFSCGKFNLKENIAGVLDDVKSAADDLQNMMVQAAQSAIASLPALILQRLNPGLYDIFQNALLEAKARVNISVASCQQLEAAMADENRNAFEEWVRVGRWAAFQEKGGAEPRKVAKVNEDVKEDNGRSGIPWVCTDGGEKAGGEGQRAIRPIRDAVTTGVNLILGRQGSGMPNDLCANTPIRGDTPGAQRLANLWDRPEDMATFAAQVVGDTTVYTYDGGNKEYQPGTGILPFIERDSVQVQSSMHGAIRQSMGMELSEATMEAISAPGLTINDQTLDALRQMQGDERAAYVQRLSDEVSVARNIEKLLLVRRALLASRDVPEVRNGPAITQINEAINEVYEQVEELMFESRVRRELVSNTALLILGEQAARRMEPVIITSPDTGGGMEHGAPSRGGLVGDETP